MIFSVLAIVKIDKAGHAIRAGAYQQTLGEPFWLTLVFIQERLPRVINA